MRILVAPLNWGLGHATRSMALIKKYLANGDDVVLAGDGDSFALLRKAFPTLPTVNLPPLNIRYSSGKSQVWAMLKAVPSIIGFSLKDHYFLSELLRHEQFDLVISDNRFGLYSDKVRCVYLTHQLFPRLPKSFRWLEPFAAWCHKKIINRYAECWVPDFENKDGSLAGDLSHGTPMPKNVKYIGPLSRFDGMNPKPDSTYEAVCVLSGPEPQRSLFEQSLVEQYSQSESTVLIVRGLPSKPATKLRKGNLVLVSHLSDNQLAPFLLGCRTIVCRSGYTSLMDMATLGVLQKVTFVPTPGQPEQEYLSEWLQSH